MSDCLGNEFSEHHDNAGEMRKRPRSSPMNLTPHRNEKRMPLRELIANHDSGVLTSPTPRLLSRTFQCMDEAIQETRGVQSSRKLSGKDEKWSETEKKALVEFLLFHCTGEHWPGHKNMEFWKSANDFVYTRSGCSSRSGMFLIMHEFL